MNTLAELYKPSLGLLTDLYQMTMAYGYWKTDKKDFDAVFHLFFRQIPFTADLPSRPVWPRPSNIWKICISIRPNWSAFPRFGGTTINRSSIGRFSNI